MNSASFLKKSFLIPLLTIFCFLESQATGKETVNSLQYNCCCGKPPLEGISALATVFGSFYATIQDEDICRGEIVPIDTISANVAVSKIGNFQFEVAESGHYYIGYAISNDTPGPLLGDLLGNVALFINGIQQDNTRHTVMRRFKLVSTSFIIPLEAGDVVDIRDIRTPGICRSWLLGPAAYDPEAVSAYINLIKLAAL